MKHVWVRVMGVALATLVVTGPVTADDPQDVDAPKARVEGAEVRKARALRESGDAHREARRYEEAIADYRAAIEVLRKRGEDHEELATSLNSLGTAIQSTGGSNDAVSLYRQALEIARRLFPGDHPYVAACLNNLAHVLTSLGKAREGLPHVEEALSMRVRLHPGDHPDVAGSLGTLGSVLLKLGDSRQSLPNYEKALAMTKRLFPGDHPDVATGLNNMAGVLLSLGRASEALRYLEEALAMRKHLFPSDHPRIARTLHDLAGALLALGRAREALPVLEEALAMRKRLFSGDHPGVAQSLNNLANVLVSLGRVADSIPAYQEALAMNKRLFPGDHPDVATGLNNLARVLVTLGKAKEALPICQDGLAMRERLCPGDHPDVAASLSNLANTLVALGNAKEALLAYKEVLAMRRRLFSGDHPDVASSLGNLAFVLGSLGQAGDALMIAESALAMYKRLFVGDHPRVALGMNNLATILMSLGRPREAQEYLEGALEMTRRLSMADDPDVAQSIHNLGSLLGQRGNAEEALAYLEEALEMSKRLTPGDHRGTANILHSLAVVLGQLGRASEALPMYEEMLAMRRRLLSDDHPEVAQGLYNLAVFLLASGRLSEAKSRVREAIEHGDRWSDCYMARALLGSIYLRKKNVRQAQDVLGAAAAHLEARRAESAILGSEGRALYMDSLRRWDPSPLLVHAHVIQGQAGQAIDVLERSRGREMLDLLHRSQDDPIRAARARAARQGHDDLLVRIDEAIGEVDETSAAVAAAAAELRRARKAGHRKEVRARKESEIDARRAHDRSLRRRLSLIREALPEGRPLKAEQVRALLAENERMLAYSLGEHSFVLVVSKNEVVAHRLGTEQAPIASGAVARAVGRYRDTLASRDATPSGASNHPGAALFEMLMPDKVWKDIKTASRVFVLPHGALHQLPFEALVVASDGGKPIYWARQGPPIAYAASAAVLGVLKARPRASGNTVVAVGDPVFQGAVQWPTQGVVVKDVAPASQAADAMLCQGDVITGYAGKDTATYEALIASIRATDPKAKQVTLAYEREGVPRTATLKPGRLGVYLAKEPPPVAGPRVLARATLGVLRGRGLRRIPGTGDEVRGIQRLLEESGKQVSVKTLLRAQATETALFEATRAPRILHLATHGIIEPDRGARASRLALTPPRVPVPGNDGFLSLGDLLERWRSRLKGTELVVLSACESHAGRLDQNEGMLALPWGFCFAGARSCIASLWQVDDQSTAKLMTALYRRMFKGETLSPCEALHGARKELMKTHPDPHHWAPFVFVGAP